MTISERIFELMAAKHLSQNDLAAHLGIRQATVSSWKTKNTTPDAKLLAPIAAFLCVSIDYLCTGKEYAPAATVQQGVFGDRNKNNTVTIAPDGAGQTLTEFESELLRIYNALDTESKAALIMRAYELSRKGGAV